MCSNDSSRVAVGSRYNWTIWYSDGTQADLSKYERPKLFLGGAFGDTPLLLINGARSGNPLGGRQTWTMIRPLTTQ
eukprot:COSAG01_NODE_17676_length_1132_cov_1.373669_1_plen_76_part_00